MAMVGVADSSLQAGSHALVSVGVILDVCCLLELLYVRHADTLLSAFLRVTSLCMLFLIVAG